MNRILLDTHIFLWALTDPRRLSAGAQASLRDDGNVLLVSVATAWEMAIKVGVGKLHLDRGVRAFVASGCRQLNAAMLPIELTHLEQLTSLPWHHRDPFDRMLVAQATADGLTLMSCDAALDAYDVVRIG